MLWRRGGDAERRLLEMESRPCRHIRRATTRSARRASMVVLGRLTLTVTLIGVGLGVFLAPGSAGAQAALDTPSQPVDLVPDLTLVVTGGQIGDAGALRDRLESIDGVAVASVDVDTGTDPIIHLALAGDAGRARPIDAIQAQAEELVDREVRSVDDATDGAADETGGSTTIAGGAGLVDRQLLDLYDRNVGWVVWAALAVGGALGLVFGLRRALATGFGLSLAVLAAGSIGGQVAGDFDGTLGTTALPAALAGLAVGAALTYRLLVWFRHTGPADGATRLEQAVTDLAPELLLVIVGGVAAAVVVDLLEPGRSAVTVAVAGAVVAALVVLAVVTPLLTVVDADGPGFRPGLLPLSIADGRDLPLYVVGLSALALLVVSVAALGPVAGGLHGIDDLDESSEVARVAAAQARLGGDPTGGLVAVAAEGTEAEGFRRWAASVAERAEVAWIDVDGRRLTASGEVPVDPAALLTDANLASVAVIVPAVDPRSAAGRSLADRVAEVAIDGESPRLAGPGAESGAAGSRTPLLTAIALLAVFGGAGVMALTGNRALAMLAAMLRLLTGAATVGFHHLVSGDPSVPSALTVLLAAGLGSSLAELELVRRVDVEDDLAGPGPRPPRRDPVPGPADANLGQFGALGLVAVAFAGAVTLVVGVLGGGPGSAQMGAALLVAAAVEAIVGVGVLRPALLAQSPTYHTVARPFRVAVHGRSTGDPETEVPPDDDPQLREAVIDLIQAEFWMQAEPGEADLDLVFECDTPVHRQAAERHASLVGAGLRVVGRSPELRALRTVRDRAPVIVTVTVDHPESQLLDSTGRVVGVRQPERRVGRLWLAPGSDGAHRIVESIELGSAPLTGL